MPATAVYSVICLAMAVLSIAPGARQRSSAAPRIRFEVQQDGRSVPIKDHAVVLQRKPFDLIFYLPDKGMVSVRSASQPALFDLAKSGGALGKIFNPAQTVAFTPFNKDEELWIDDPTLQASWFYDSSDKDHPFSEVTRDAGGLLKCRRRVSNVVIGDKATPIGATDFEAVYLVFLTGKSAADYVTTIEDRRDWLKIAFSGPVPAPAAAAAANPFAIAVEQLASAVPIVNHEVKIRKAPFDILVDLEDIPGVYVHAAFDDAFYARAQRREPLGRVFRKYQTMALGRFNDGQLLFINDEESHQFWYSAGRTEHDFSMVMPIPGGVRGRRVIANVWQNRATMLLHRVPQSVLYLVFYAGDLSLETDSEAQQRAHERQRETLKITMQ